MPNNSGPVDCTPFFFLIPCRRADAFSPIEILVEQQEVDPYAPRNRKRDREIGIRLAYGLPAVALSNAGWESSVPDYCEPVDDEVKPENLLQDTIRIAVKKHIGAEDFLALGVTTPFFYRAAGRGDCSPSLAIGIPVQITGGSLNDGFTWVNPEELFAAQDCVLVTPSASGECFAEMITEAVRIFEETRGADGVMRKVLAFAESIPSIS